MTMRRSRRLAATLLGLLALPASAPARAAASGGGDLKVATWNMEWLTTRPKGDPSLPDDAAPKQDQDIVTLAGYAVRLDAAVVALEEIDDPALVARIFPPDRYRILMTADHVVQRVALVVRRDIQVTQNPDLVALDVARPGAHQLRSGLDATVTVDGRTIRLLAVHLKSGCWEGPLQGSSKFACVGLSAQLPVLQAWIAARQAEGMPYLVLGDFNRRLKAGDALLQGLQAAAPLAVATAGHASPCWGGEDFIDQILAGGPARLWMQPDTLRVLVYRETDPAMKERISDHCPVSIHFALPGAGPTR